MTRLAANGLGESPSIKKRPRTCRVAPLKSGLGAFPPPAVAALSVATELLYGKAAHRYDPSLTRRPGHTSACLGCQDGLNLAARVCLGHIPDHTWPQRVRTGFTRWTTDAECIR